MKSIYILCHAGTYMIKNKTHHNQYPHDSMINEFQPTNQDMMVFPFNNITGFDFYQIILPVLLTWGKIQDTLFNSYWQGLQHNKHEILSANVTNIGATHSHLSCYYHLSTATIGFVWSSNVAPNKLRNPAWHHHIPPGRSSLNNKPDPIHWHNKHRFNSLLSGHCGGGDWDILVCIYSKVEYLILLHLRWCWIHCQLAIIVHVLNWKKSSPTSKGPLVWNLMHSFSIKPKQTWQMLCHGGILRKWCGFAWFLVPCRYIKISSHNASTVVVKNWQQLWTTLRSDKFISSLPLAPM